MPTTAPCSNSPNASPALQRTACDRCRHHKLKCLRDSGTEQCRRCIRANESCFTSPARKAGRPQRLFRSQSPANQTMLQTPPSSTQNASPDSNDHFSLPEGSIGAVGHGLVTSYDASPLEPPLDGIASATVEDRIGQITRRSECMKTLGTLNSEVLHDLDMAKGCHVAPECLEVLRDNALPDPNPDFMIGRILNHTKTLIEIVDMFDLSQDAAPYGSESSEAGLFCDTPVMFSMMTCYISLIRTYRTMFACLHESIPFFQTGVMHNSHLQLLPNLDFGGFKLSGRIDLQLQVLVQVCEDLICKLDTKFGVGGGATTRTWDRSVGPNKATGLLWMMIEQEISEQPPLDRPRGHCGSLKEIFASIRKDLQMDNQPNAETPRI